MLVYLMMIDSPMERSKFEKVYLEYKGLMFHVAYQILRNEEDAEDAVQNAFVKIAENISKIEDAVCPKTQHYVITIVENKAIDLYRGNRRRSAAKYMDDISGISVDPGRVHGLALCLEKLPAKYREVILLKYYHGFSTKEIAQILKITQVNAIKLDQRAQNRLMKICKEEGIL